MIEIWEKIYPGKDYNRYSVIKSINYILTSVEINKITGVMYILLS